MRTIFDNIIDNENLEPKEGIEYIYNLDIVWKPNELDNHPVVKGLIVENVKQLDAGDYSFNIKGLEEDYRCTYGWAFIENTEENIELLNQINEEEIKLKEQQLIIKDLRNKITGLYNRKNEHDDECEC